MANIEERRSKDGAVTYRVKVRLRGHAPVTATFERKTDARRWAAKIETEIREGRYFGAGRRRTVGEAIDRYLTDRLSALSRHEQDNRTHQLRWWRERLGHQFLADLTAPILGEHRDALAAPDDDGKALAAGTVVHYLNTISKLLNCCVEWGWLQANPAAGVRKPEPARGRVRFLSDAERGALLDACRADSNPVLYPLVMLALCTGARRGELLRLCWPDVDTERARVVFHETKNGERRSVPLISSALAVIDDLGRVRRIDDDRVFGRATFPQRAWERAVATAAVEDFRFHDLRHTTASYLAMRGASLLEISDVLGHKSISMVKRYSHLTEGHTRRVLDRMGADVFGVRE